MNLQVINLPDGETLLPIVLFGANRSMEVTNWHRRVMVDHFGWGINYVEAPFTAGISHGAAMNQMWKVILDMPVKPTYVWWCDNDNIALREEALSMMVDTVRNKVTVFGEAWNSSHKVGPNGTAQHTYCSQACLCLPTDLYVMLGCPDCDHHNPRSDTAEEITYEAQFRGYGVSLLYPSHTDTKTTALDNGCFYGRGNTYGPNLWYHESRADLEGHEERFVAKCQAVIRGDFLTP